MEEEGYREEEMVHFPRDCVCTSGLYLCGGRLDCGGSRASALDYPGSAAGAGIGFRSFIRQCLDHVHNLRRAFHDTSDSGTEDCLQPDKERPGRNQMELIV